MTPHHHDFKLIDILKMRYRCDCGVIGRLRGRQVVAVTCHHKTPRSAGRTHCGADAVYVDGERLHSRCAAHAPPEAARAAG